jgi:hypothetical protein
MMRQLLSEVVEPDLEDANYSSDGGDAAERFCGAEEDAAALVFRAIRLRERTNF